MSFNICILIAYLMSISLIRNQEFCSNSEQIKAIFLMSDYNYIKKGSLFYRQKTNETFANTNGKHSKDFFQKSLF